VRTVSPCTGTYTSPLLASYTVTVWLNVTLGSDTSVAVTVVVPAFWPYTTPLLVTVATDSSLELHFHERLPRPSGVVTESASDPPFDTRFLPVMGPRTVTCCTTVAPPLLALTLTMPADTATAVPLASIVSTFGFEDENVHPA